jgi:choline dehydrogenase-like flavoprotein
VGCGAGGSVLLQRLARAGWRVAALDAGPFWDPNPALTIMAVAARAADHLIAGAPA